MYNRKHLKQTAKTDLNGNWTLPILLTLLSFLLGIPQAVDEIVFKNIGVSHHILVVGTLAVSFLVGLMTTGIYLGIVRGKSSELSRIFGNPKYVFKFLGIYIMYTLVITLGFILLIIPGLILSYSYSQFMFVFIDNPDIGILECLRTSRRLMKGYKWKLFVLGWSFFPWFLLVCITLGLAIFYVNPYLMTTHSEFYLFITGELQFEVESDTLTRYN